MFLETRSRLDYGVDDDHTLCQLLGSMDQPPLSRVNMGQAVAIGGLTSRTCWYKRDGSILNHGRSHLCVYHGGFFTEWNLEFLATASRSWA